jgi:hypothetical protein
MSQRLRTADQIVPTLAYRDAIPTIDLAIGVSAFNRQDLDDMGSMRPRRVPILIDCRLYDTPPESMRFTHA